MRTSLTAVLLLAAVSTAAAQQPPQFDAKPGCQAGARSGISDKPDAEACLRGETQSARRSESPMEGVRPLPTSSAASPRPIWAARRATSKC